MGDKTSSSEETVSKMFVGKRGEMSADEELALSIIHRFNIDCDTLDDMPAFEEHMKILFSKGK